MAAVEPCPAVGCTPVNTAPVWNSAVLATGLRVPMQDKLCAGWDAVRAVAFLPTVCQACNPARRTVAAGACTWTARTVSSIRLVVKHTAAPPEVPAVTEPIAVLLRHLAVASEPLTLL